MKARMGAGKTQLWTVVRGQGRARIRGVRLGRDRRLRCWQTRLTATMVRVVRPGRFPQIRE